MSRSYNTGLSDDKDKELISNLPQVTDFFKAAFSGPYLCNMNNKNRFRNNEIIFITQQKINTIICLISLRFSCYFLLLTGAEKHIRLIFSVLEKYEMSAFAITFLLLFLFLSVILLLLFNSIFYIKIKY